MSFLLSGCPKFRCNLWTVTNSIGLVVGQKLDDATDLLLFFIDSTHKVHDRGGLIEHETSRKDSSKSRLVVLKILSSSTNSRGRTFEQTVLMTSITSKTHLIEEETFGSQNGSWLLDQFPKTIRVQASGSKPALIQQGEVARKLP